MLERSSIHIADALLQRRIGIDIVDALAGRTDAAARNAPEQLRLINANVHRNQRRHSAEVGELGVEPGSLRESSRATVKNVARMNIGVRHASPNHVVHDLVRHQLTLIHQGLRRLAQGSTLRNILAEDVSSGDLWNPKRSEERRVGKECRSRWSPY